MFVPAPGSLFLAMVCSHGFTDRGRGRPDVYSQMWLFRSIWPGLSSPWGWSEEQKFRPHRAHGKQISSRYVCVSL